MSPEFIGSETERIAGKGYRTRDEAKADVFDYIERFYNTARRTPPSAISARLSSNGRWN